MKAIEDTELLKRHGKLYDTRIKRIEERIAWNKSI